MGPGRQIGPVLHRRRQPVLDQSQAFEGDALGHGVVVRRAIGLEAVGQGVHAGPGGDVARQADGQLRIGDDDGRHHPGVKDDLLEVGGLVGDDRGAADFGAGAGGGRHGDDGGNAVGVDPGPPVLAILEIPDWPVLPDHQCDGLGGIEAAAATEGDNTVAAGVLVGGDPIGHILAHRVAFDVGEQRCRQAGVVVGGDGALHHGQVLEAGIGGQQGAGHAEIPAGVGKLSDAARTEAHVSGEVPVAAKSLRIDGHGCASVNNVTL